MAAGSRISPLPPDLRARISSSHEITSQEHVLDGLVKNALDACARSVTIEADFAKGYLSVLDDGTGIEQVEFTEAGHLAQIHCMSTLAQTVLL